MSEIGFTPFIHLQAGEGTQYPAYSTRAGLDTLKMN